MANTSQRLESCHENSLYGLLQNEHHDLKEEKFLLSGSQPSVRPCETGVLPNYKSTLKTRTSSANTAQLLLSVPVPSYLADQLFTSSFDTGKFQGDSSDNGTSDPDERNSDTSAGQDTREELEYGANSETIVADVLHSTRISIADRVMEEFWVMFNQEWSFDFAQHAGDSSETSRSSNAESKNHGKDARHTSRKKRQRDDEDLEDQNGDRKSRAPRKISPGGKGSEESIKFACPFRKQNPRKFNIYSHRTCTLSHWNTIARLKYVPQNIPISKFRS